MTGIATATETNLMLFYMQQNQSQLETVNAQVSTGIKAETYAGIAPDASNLVDFRAQASQQQSYIDTINTVGTRMQLMSQSLTSIVQQVQRFTANLPDGAFTTGQPNIATQAKLLLQQVAGDLNVQDGTRYLFAGTSTATPPVDLASLPTGGAATLTTAVNGTPASGGYYAGGGAIPPVRIDQQVTVSYGITANDASTFEPVIRVLNFLANNGPFSSTSATDQANISQASQMLNQAVQSLNSMDGTLGLQQAQANQSQTVHQNTLSIAQTGIGNIVSVDPATAITELQALETQLQASYTATSQVSKLTLASFL